MEGDGHPTAVRMLVALVATLLPPEEKAVLPEGAYDLRAVTDFRRPYLIAMSDGYCDPCVRQHFDVFARALRKGNAVLDEFPDNHPDYFVDMLEGLLLRVAPRGSAVLLQSRTVGVPAIVIRLHHYFKTVGLHVPPAYF
jgi:hypothetical protein